MDIKKRIQELSLDQKAKLYYMGLVRQGKIDRLPEDPKAAYIKDMMGKMDTIQKISPKADRSSLEKLAGIDMDDYGRSISGKDKRTFMEPEDSMPAARARKLAGMEDDEMETRYDYDDPIFEDLKEIASELGYLNENQPTVFDDQSMDELLNIILKYVKDPDDAQAELDRFDQGGFDALSNMVAANLLRDPEYQAWYNKLHSINKSVDISYTDPGFRFYKMKVNGKRLNREEGTEYLKGLGIDMEIPRSYNETTLDKIVDKLKEKGIDADYDAAMDVS